MDKFLIIFIIGVWIVAREVGKRAVKCPTNKVVVKYIPRTAEEEERSVLDVSDMFKDMFNKSSPWIVSSTDDVLFRRTI